MSDTTSVVVGELVNDVSRQCLSPVWGQVTSDTSAVVVVVSHHRAGCCLLRFVGDCCVEVAVVGVEPRHGVPPQAAILRSNQRSLFVQRGWRAYHACPYLFKSTTACRLLAALAGLSNLVHDSSLLTI